MTAVARLDLEKLTKICGLFASDLMGERAAAAHKANEIIKAAGLTWEDVLQPAAPTYRPADPPPRAMSAGEILALYGDRLNEYETIFLASIIKRYLPLTEKQVKVLDRIRAKVAGCGR